MADRTFDRLFNEAQAKERAVEEAYLATLPTIHTEADDENILRRASAPMTAADGIARILLAWKDKDYFRLLQLDRPEADALGRPVWAGTDADVSRAYRRISILVHPDKFRGDDSRQADARTAFEALNEAYRMLQDKGMMEQILAKEAEAARERRCKREAEATLQERMVMNSQHKEAKTALIEDEGKAFSAMMKRQRDDRLDAMKRKKTRASRVGDSGSDGESYMMGSLLLWQQQLSKRGWRQLHGCKCKKNVMRPMQRPDDVPMQRNGKTAKRRGSFRHNYSLAQPVLQACQYHRTWTVT